MKVEDVTTQTFRELVDLEDGKTVDMMYTFRIVGAIDSRLGCKYPQGYVVVWNVERDTVGLMKVGTEVEVIE